MAAPTRTAARSRRSRSRRRRRRLTIPSCWIENGGLSTVIARNGFPAELVTVTLRRPRSGRLEGSTARLWAVHPSRRAFRAPPATKAKPLRGDDVAHFVGGA